MVFSRKFRFYLVFLYYCRFIGIWFVIGLLRCSIVHHFVVTFYLCEDDSDKQSRSDQSKISNYGRQYIKEPDILVVILSNLYTLYRFIIDDAFFNRNWDGALRGRWAGPGLLTG